MTSQGESRGLAQAQATVPGDVLVRAVGVSKHFGRVRAVESVDLEIRKGRTMAIVGHNGAGKSTMNHVLAGGMAPDTGSLEIDGDDVTSHYGMKSALALGVRIVYQELSLCPTLSVVENFKVVHRSIKGPGWRRRARSLARSSLDEVFPENTVPLDVAVGKLPIGQRHMVEIARAAATSEGLPVNLLILDEPTASLDATTADQLFRWIRRQNARGTAVVFISHRLSEVISNSDDIVVMRDGRVVGTGPSTSWSSDRLVELMGTVQAGTAEVSAKAVRQEPGRRRRLPSGADAGEAAVEVGSFTSGHLSDINMSVRRGEVVGLGGLEGHGQYDLLLSVFRAANRRFEQHIHVKGEAAFVTGDRGNEGVFPLFGVDRNITVGALSRVGRAGFLPPAREESMAREWIDRLRIRVDATNSPILSLSGGSQQKVLLARALAAEADVLLLNDPMRGVDIGTKRELYGILRNAADNGVAVIWYATEYEELLNCDRVYIFQRGRLVKELAASEMSEEAVLRASFAETHAS